MPYKNIEINTTQYSEKHTNGLNQFYKGFSTVDSTRENKLYDFDLIKQDILNHFNTRRGERVMNPLFGAIIWDILMEPLTEDIGRVIEEDVTAICNFDPRVYPQQIDINEYEQGYLIEITLTMRGTDQSSVMRLAFDQRAGLVVQ